MFFYFITFGGFVGLANALPLYFTVQYHVGRDGGPAGLAGRGPDGFRPVGGLIADRIGGIRSLSVLFGIVASYLVIAFVRKAGGADAAGWSLLQMPRIAWMSVVLFSIGVLALGMGNGAVFQLIRSASVRTSADDRPGRLRRRRQRHTKRREPAPPRPRPAASGPASCFSGRWHCLALSDLPWSRSGGARHGAPSPGARV
jgi:hypothetical protein